MPDTAIQENAALLFQDGQLVLRYQAATKNGPAYKLLSPQAVRSAFNQLPVDSGWLPAGVRRWGVTPQGEFVVLVLPAARYTLRLTNTFPERFPGKRFVRIETPLPALVLIGRDRNYDIWACAEEPTPDVTVYRAPLPNVHDNGKICFGSNHPPKAGPDTIAQVWEIFIRSPFNDHLANACSCAEPKDVREQLLRSSRRRARAYPADDLVPAQRTLRQVMKQAIGENEEWN